MDDHAIVIADTNGTIRSWSVGCEKLFGYPETDAIGRSLNTIVPEQYREKHWNAFYRAMQEGRSKIDGETSNVPVLCKDGAVRNFPSRFHLLRDGSGQTIGAMTIFSSGTTVP